LKNANNSLYELRKPLAGSEVHRWYVVRDIGAGLGATGRLNPPRGNPFSFERTAFIKGVKGEFVLFDYHGRHTELVTHITPDDVRWMAALLSRLRPEQWRDAFRAGGYGPETSEWFIERIRIRLDDADALPAL
jgi:hypothetical protein